MKIFKTLKAISVPLNLEHNKVWQFDMAQALVFFLLAPQVWPCCRNNSLIHDAVVIDSQCLAVRVELSWSRVYHHGNSFGITITCGREEVHTWFFHVLLHEELRHCAKIPCQSWLTQEGNDNNQLIEVVLSARFSMRSKEERRRE